MGKTMKGQERPAKRGGVKGLITAAAVALTVAAVIKELRTPAPERTWHGKVASVVPYEFRPPTLERVRERLWDPEAAHVVGPRVFGVGWSVNLGRVLAVARAKIGA
ncbi:DUF5808 domain-containing protein [Promicromonospora thailandica]|uniref:DUF5808 domain-containing protein n=1 Tax=Promicromonospora thailandica TaxID=765201 RepID=A0A9X2G4A5_9MICO|nr:DUF5808 domain-containing protein [Promicromonospora thailandica]MCP2266534.1 hypothetical protein [Promicromonospora thailandica]BFF17394.1 hypothetical protein GCM10025730_09150 [Promicromonospora thailandica]